MTVISSVTRDCVTALHETISFNESTAIVPLGQA